MMDMQVVFATCNAAMRLGQSWSTEYKLTVVDEAGQASEVEIWIPLALSSYAIIGGDENQLGPVNNTTHQEFHSCSFLERLMQTKLASRSTVTLTTQFRMSHNICHWSSVTFYLGKLLPHDSVSAGKFPNLPSVDWINFKATGETKTKSKLNSSIYNMGEVDEIMKYVSKIIAPNVPPGTTIGIIAPYSDQVRMLEKKINNLEAKLDIKVATIDGYQGGECDVIILSAVRSNEKGSVGFAADEKRINVAVTRAKKHFAIIADTKTLITHPIFSDLYAYINLVKNNPQKFVCMV